MFEWAPPQSGASCGVELLGYSDHFDYLELTNVGTLGVGILTCCHMIMSITSAEEWMDENEEADAGLGLLAGCRPTPSSQPADSSWLHEKKGTCGDGVSVIDNLATGMRAKIFIVRYFTCTEMCMVRYEYT